MPDFVVYFSPSGVQFTIELSDTDLLPLKNLKVSTVNDKDRLHVQIVIDSTIKE